MNSFVFATVHPMTNRFADWSWGILCENHRVATTTLIPEFMEDGYSWFLFAFVYESRETGRLPVLEKGILLFVTK